MSSAIKREDSALILKKIDEGRLNLKKENMYSCLCCFRESLSLALKTKMLPGDERQVIKAINEFQQHLSSSPVFKQLYGPVTFHDNELKISLDFVEQLLRLSEEELADRVAHNGSTDVAATAVQKNADGGTGEAARDESQEERIREARLLLDKGEFGRVKEILGDDDESTSLLLQITNNLGIQYRKTGQMDKAIAEFRKAMALYPDDEGLYYNIARAYFEKKEWEAAAAAITQGIAINPDFNEGKLLLSYIKRQSSGGGK